MRFIPIIILCVVGLIFVVDSKPVSCCTEQVASSTVPDCPECGCSLMWTGKTEYCVGIRCRTVKVYRCGCCRKLWNVYQD